MNRTTDLLMSIRRTVKLYESMLKTVCERYQLSAIETDIISFLYNNPTKDTAGDIVELRMLSKGNVSQAVESLIQKGFIRRVHDTKDRRRIHLFLLPEASPVTQSIEQVRSRFQEKAFYGFSEQERELYAALTNRIMQNVSPTQAQAKDSSPQKQ